MSSDGCYINWLAVSKDSFEQNIYGKFANDKPFRGMGIATFLLQMVQIQASSLGTKVNLYLQSNISSEAYHWYQNRGFVMTPTHTPDELLGALKDFYDRSQSTPIK